MYCALLNNVYNNCASITHIHVLLLYIHVHLSHIMTSITLLSTYIYYYTCKCDQLSVLISVSCQVIGPGIGD